MGQDIVSAQLLKGISVGTILWIKELADGDDNERYGLPSSCFKHPCVVVDLAASRKGFAQIYVITSKGDRNVNDVPLPQHVRGRYVPIHPKPINALLPDVQLHLAGSFKLRKDSYVNTEKVYTFPLACLERYSRKQQVSDFCLDPPSIRWLRAKAFGKPLLDTPIEQITTPTASTSHVPTYYSPVQSPLSYAAVLAPRPQTYPTFRNDEPLPHAAVQAPRPQTYLTFRNDEPLPHAAVQAPRPQTYLTFRNDEPLPYAAVKAPRSQTYVTFRNNEPLPHAAVQAPRSQTYVTFRNDELPYSSRSRDTTQPVAHTVCIFVLAATAALLVCGITLWL